MVEPASGRGGSGPGILRHPLAEQIHQTLDHRLDAQTVGDQLDRIGRLPQGRHGAAGIEVIPLGDLGFQFRQGRHGETALGQIGGPAPGPLRHRGGEEHLAFRLRENGGADVAPLGHQAAPPAHGLLLAGEGLPHTGVGRHGGHQGRDLRTADRLAHLVAVHPYPLLRRRPHSPAADRGPPGAGPTAAGSAGSAPWCSTHQVRARYMAPVSR